uniref:Uncharacterized protein n=1 Tax=Arundo donax TaxID=35708 RepID=A0A0A8ZS21_ARUDO
MLMFQSLSGDQSSLLALAPSIMT